MEDEVEVDLLQKYLHKKKINAKNVFDFKLPKVINQSEFKVGDETMAWGKISSTLSIEA